MKKKNAAKKVRRIIVLSVLGLVLLSYGGYQIFKSICTHEEHQFLDVVLLIPKKVMQDQGSTRLCWAYTGLAMIEAEIQRKGLEPVDLSEAYIAYYNSFDRTKNTLTKPYEYWDFGGCLADVWSTVKEHGIIREADMQTPTDMNYQMLKSEMKGDEGLVSLMRESSQLGDKEGVDLCRDNIIAAHQRCFGDIPTQIVFLGDSITPQEFAERMNINPDDFIQVTSMTTHKYNDWCVLMYHDHWRQVPAWNVPLDTMMALIDRSIEKGYTVAWDGDISERNFQWHYREGFAKLMGKHERMVSPEWRQRMIDWNRTTDDHTMLIAGTAKDENGNKYYIMKNSWGKQLPNGGMLFMSPAYLRYKTIVLTFNREVLGM